MDYLTAEAIKLILANPILFGGVAVTCGMAGFGFKKLLADSTEKTLNERVKLAEDKAKSLAAAPKPIPSPIAAQLTSTSTPDSPTQHMPGQLKWRDTSTNLLPPRPLYESASREVFILGPTCKQTVLSYAEIFRSLLLAGRSVRLVLLKPHGEQSMRLSEIEGVNLDDEIQATIDLIETRHKLTELQGFEYHLLDVHMPYTAVLVDGDISCDNDVKANVSGAVLRVQPRTFTKSQHSGPILQLLSSSTDPTFQYFADDLRRLYRAAKSAA